LFDVNVLGTILVSQAALPHFPEAGGSVINMSSIVSLYPSEGGQHTAQSGHMKLDSFMHTKTITVIFALLSPIARRIAPSI
jgi:NAD(P)-dependent dehydrogenase (short-subunit alcohol dehydrogenase family)